MNLLQFETSPYLLQHKNNPVHWRAWNEESLKLARSEDKVIVLSIGYSACHWCHVMEHECFEDEEVAEIMNTYFVNIKVDREERPDIDQIYMDALQAMGIQGGWPLNVFLLPTGEPFYGGTYFPKPKWINVLKGIQQVFSTRREEVMASGRGFVKSINMKDSEKYYFGKNEEDNNYTKDELEEIAEKLAKDFDEHDGGTQRSPKFPMPSLWNMVYHLGQELANELLLSHVYFTMGRMALGGIYDHVGGGWTRYSTDAYWKVPHFEKMLYDNGQLMKLYSEAYPNAEHGKELFKWAVNGTYQWLKTEMLVKEGGFYAALDADSEGEEGKYYVWTEAEWDRLQLSSTLKEQYGISSWGNWEDGKNVLHLETAIEEWEEFLKTLHILKENRDLRPRPGIDHKVLTGWNALAISGLVYRALYLNEDARLAKQQLDYLNAKHSQYFENENGDRAIGLWHQAGSRKILGFLDDYAAMIQANIDMYSVTFEEDYLLQAEGLMKYVLANFYDSDEGLFYYTDSEAEKLIARKKELFDNVIPSSNSMIAKGLYYLGRYMSNAGYLALAERMFAKVKPLTLQDPQWLSNWVDLGILLTVPKKEVVVTGVHYKEWIGQLRTKYTRLGTIFIGANASSKLDITAHRFHDTTTLFLCENSVCQLPITQLSDII